MRGTLPPRLCRVHSSGIIPAHAGNTGATARGAGRHRDHPRACGEHFLIGRRLRIAPGSSPRMRGTLVVADLDSAIRGIIPAHAGNTQSRCGDFTCSWDHPRACGEHMVESVTIMRAPGSSPRMRGTPRHEAGVDLRAGIIPAHAGNTEYRHSLEYVHRDHPRACGEHGTQWKSSSFFRGSSPRMRGTLNSGVENKPPLGIIPAHAGNTRGYHDRRAAGRDHPRACGEHVISLFVASPKEGSSPRMRGTRVLWPATTSTSGIIPAHAGNTRLT